MAKERQRARLFDANALFQQQHASAAADAAAVATDGDAPGTVAGREADEAAAATGAAGAEAAHASAAEAPGGAVAAPHDDVKAEARMDLAPCVHKRTHAQLRGQLKGKGMVATTPFAM